MIKLYILRYGWYDGEGFNVHTNLTKLLASITNRPDIQSELRLGFESNGRGSFHCESNYETWVLTAVDIDPTDVDTPVPHYAGEGI